MNRFPSLASVIVVVACIPAVGRSIVPAPPQCFAMQTTNVYYSAGTCYNCPGNHFDAVAANQGFEYLYTTSYATVTCSQGATRVRPDGSKYCDLSSSVQTTRSIAILYGGPDCGY